MLSDVAFCEIALAIAIARFIQCWNCWGWGGVGEGFMEKAPYCGSGIGSNEHGEYCRAVLR